MTNDEGANFKRLIRDGLLTPDILKIEKFLLSVLDAARTLKFSDNEKMALNQAYHQAWWHRERLLKQHYPERKGIKKFAPSVFPEFHSEAEMYLENLVATNAGMATNLVVSDKIVENINKTYDFIAKKAADPANIIVEVDEPKRPRFLYKIPAGTQWKNIMMNFKSETEVEITVGRHVLKTGFADMGFADGRTVGKPNMQWTLLKILARKGGSLIASDSEVSNNFKKQKQLLADRLSEYFTLEADPFHTYTAKKGYALKMLVFMEENALTPEMPQDERSEVEEMFGVFQGGI